MPRIPTKEEFAKAKKEYLLENAKKWKIVKRILDKEVVKARTGVKASAFFAL